MSKVTQQAFMRRPLGDGTPDDASARRREANDHRDDSDDLGEQREREADGPDLKATVTLSGEALAALLEEVKNAQRTPTPGSEPAPTEGEAEPSRRGPQRSAGKT
jgi:hypothetical protein